VLLAYSVVFTDEDETADNCGSRRSIQLTICTDKLLDIS